MKLKLLIYKITICVIVIMQCGCEDNLDVKPSDKISDAAVWKDINLMDAYLSELYSRIPHGFHCAPGQILINSENVTDNSRQKSGWISSNSIVVPGQITPSSNPFGSWSHCYNSIRACNIFIEQLPNSIYTEDKKSTKIAEAKFVRAFMYWILVRGYGGVPIITKSLSVSDDLSLPRDTYKDCVDFILNELAECANDLSAIDEIGNEYKSIATKEACIAMASRMCMYAERWKEGAAYAKKIIDDGKVSLYSDYNELFVKKQATCESIFEIYFSFPERGHNFNWVNEPRSFRVDWGSQSNPTQELVDAYEMINGKKITDPTSGYDPQNPYLNRDKRFYATILYHNAPYKGRFVDTRYKKGGDGLGVDYLSSVTGYYVRKFLEEDLEYGQEWQTTTTWPELRYAEILLIYAECKNEDSGPDESVYSAMNAIRERAGLPNLPTDLDQGQMRKRIRNERRVELAFENQRIYDIRRWDIGNKVLNDKLFHGMKVTDGENGKLHYDPSYVNEVGGTQVWHDRFKLWPIPKSECEKNKNMTQNPGY